MAVLEQLGQVVARDQHRHPALRGQVLHEASHLDHAERIQAIDRLIEDQQLRIGDQGQRDPEPLPHAEGEVLDLLAAGPAEPHQLQQVLLDGRVGHAPLQPVQVHVLRRGHPAVQAGGLDQRADTGEVLLARDLRSGAEQLDAPRGGGAQPGDQPHQAGLAGAVAADQAVDPPSLQPDAHRLHRGMLAVTFGQVPGDQDVLAHHRTSCLFSEVAVWLDVTEQRWGRE